MAKVPKVTKKLAPEALNQGEPTKTAKVITRAIMPATIPKGELIAPQYVSPYPAQVFSTTPKANRQCKEPISHDGVKSTSATNGATAPKRRGRPLTASKTLKTTPNPTKKRSASSKALKIAQRANDEQSERVGQAMMKLNTQDAIIKAGQAKITEKDYHLAVRDSQINDLEAKLAELNAHDLEHMAALPLAAHEARNIGANGAHIFTSQDSQVQDIYGTVPLQIQQPAQSVRYLLTPEESIMEHFFASQNPQFEASYETVPLIAQPPAQTPWCPSLTEGLDMEWMNDMDQQQSIDFEAMETVQTHPLYPSPPQGTTMGHLLTSQKPQFKASYETVPLEVERPAQPLFCPSPPGGMTTEQTGEVNQQQSWFFDDVETAQTRQEACDALMAASWQDMEDNAYSPHPF